MGLPLLSINHVTVRYLNNTLFTNLNFKITEGQHWALIGESGSGKSALLQTLAGRFNITGGDIDWHFYNNYLKQAGANTSLSHYKLIALVEPKHHFRNLSNTSDFYYQQRYNSSDSEDALTVDAYLQSVTVALRNNAYWTFEKVLSTLKLKDLQQKQIIKLSNGETKRLMLAAALLKNPLLIIAG